VKNIRGCSSGRRRSEGWRDYEARAASSPLAPALLQLFWGRQFAPPPACPVFAVRLQALRMACSWFSSTRKSWGGGVGLFRGVLIHSEIPVWSIGLRITGYRIASQGSRAAKRREMLEGKTCPSFVLSICCCVIVTDLLEGNGWRFWRSLPLLTKKCPLFSCERPPPIPFPIRTIPKLPRFFVRSHL
jgi:hypothetical protein